jgi:hypothetical protein
MSENTVCWYAIGGHRSIVVICSCGQRFEQVAVVCGRVENSSYFAKFNTNFCRKVFRP